MRRRVLRTSDLYIARAVVVGVAGAWAVLLALDLVLAFADQIRRTGEGYTAMHALAYTAWSVPRRLYALFPSAAVVGSLLGLGGLAATSELTALRAAGLSRLRICAGAALPLALLTGGMVVVGETAGPVGEQRAQALAASARSSDILIAAYSGVWVREGSTFINVGRGFARGSGADAWVELEDVRLYDFDDEGRLLSIAAAERAEYRAEGWLLDNVRRTRFGERSAQLEEVASERWDTALDAGILAASVVRPRYMNTAQLGAMVRYLEANQSDPGEFAQAYWARWFYPLNVLALCLAAMPFAFGQLRLGGFGKRLFAGIVFGLAFFLFDRLATDIADVYGIDPRLGHLVAPTLVLVVSWLLFYRRT